MKDVYVGISVSVGLLLVVGLGAGGWYAYHHMHPAATMVTPNPATLGSPIVSASGTPVASTGTSSTAANAAAAAASSAAAAKLLAEQQAREAEWRRTDKIQSLQRELDGVWNQIKINDTQIQTIEARSVPPGMYQQVKDELYKTCMATKGWFFAGLQCDSEVPESRIQTELKTRWATQLSSESRPYRASNSELDSRQRNLITNLAQLGVTVNPVMVKGTA